MNEFCAKNKLKMKFILFLFFIYCSLLQKTNAASGDGGFVVYCPCMGRFGNQADHFLGALAFSKGIDRTLILPPWVEYKYGEAKSIQVPFDKYFKVNSLLKYHNVVTMESFMKNNASKLWPSEKRISFCYMSRMGELINSCNAKSGNPFGPFWDTFKINFSTSEFYGPLNYDAHNLNMMQKWKEKYSREEWPVLAFTGAPASFPVQKENIGLQKFLNWSEDIEKRSRDFIVNHLKGGSFIAIHLRNGLDWSRACEHVKDTPYLFASPQCTGYTNEWGPLTESMCLPSKEQIIRQIRRAAKKIESFKNIFVASDSNHMLDELKTAFGVNVNIVRLTPSSPHVDLAILGQANYFIGNCVSSFTAFVKRERDVRGLPSEFWSFPQVKKTKREEL